MGPDDSLMLRILTFRYIGRDVTLSHTKTPDIVGKYGHVRYLAFRAGLRQLVSGPLTRGSRLRHGNVLIIRK